MHIVEIRRDGDDLAGPAAQMRTFLDGIGIQPSMFRVSLVPGGPLFRVEFTVLRQAVAFARAFDGKITTAATADRSLAA
jgi:hypothetical protein